MKKSVKAWLIIAAALVVLGSFLFVGVMFSVNWDFSKIGTTQYEMNTYEIGEDFANISINTDTADIKFFLSEEGKCRVECFEEEKSKHEVMVQENTLVIKQKEEKAWYDYIGVNFSPPKITVFLPKAEFESIVVKESTGDISFSKLFANTIDITLSTGDVFLRDISCKTLTSTANTGEIELENVIALEKINIKRSTGDVEFTDCDAAEIFVDTDTGDVEGSLLSPKVFITQTSTGKIDVPKTTAGGRCEITTDTGDIKITTSK